MKNVKKIITAVILILYSLSGYTQALPDPTRPAEYQTTTVVIQDLPKELIDWSVTAIRISDDDRSAIVNGTIVRTGDIIGPATIQEIQPQQVILDYNNRPVAVRLFNHAILRKQASNGLETVELIE